MAQGRYKNGSHTQAAAAGKIDAGIALSIVTEHDFAGADGFGRDAGVGLQADAEVRSGASGASAADDFVAGPEGDGGPGSAGEVLGALGNGADRGLEIEFSGMDFDVFGNGDRLESRGRMGGICNTKLAALREQGHAGVLIGIERVWDRDRAEQVANQAIEFGISDEVRGLLMEERSSEDAGEPNQGMATACEAIRLGTGTDQFALNAECGGLQRDKRDFLESRAIHGLTKHDC
jgi:hypothetical protein